MARRKNLSHLKAETVESFLARGGKIQTTFLDKADLRRIARNEKKTKYEKGNDLYDAESYKQRVLRGMV